MKKLTIIAGLIIAVMLVAGPGHATYDSSLRGYWKMNGEWLDSSNYGNDGSGQNGVTFDTGKVGQAGNFDGDNDCVALAGISQPNMFNITSAYTISYWANFDTTIPKIILQDMYDASGPTYGNGIFQRGSPTTIAILQYEVDGENGTRRNAAGSGSGASTGEWHHYSAVRNGSSVSYYLDGTKMSISENQFTAANIQYATSYKETLYRTIGAYRQPGVPYDYAYLLDGMLDELAVWNVAKSDDYAYRNYVMQHIRPDITDEPTRTAYEAELESIFAASFTNAGISYAAFMDGMIDYAINDYIANEGVVRILPGGVEHYEPQLTGSGPYSFDFSGSSFAAYSWDWSAITGGDYLSLDAWYEEASIGQIITADGDAIADFDEVWFMKTGGGVEGQQPIPEPASCISLLIGLGLAVRRKFRS